MFTKYGYTIIGIVSIIIFLFIVAALFINNNPVKISIIVVAVFSLLITLNFFRDPDRTTPQKDGIIVSPADGKIININNDSYNDYIGGQANKISIFMSPLNVHVNRIPVSGLIEYLNYFEGKFIAAFEDKASANNERMEIGIESNHGKVMFSQIAGFVARRIVTELEIGDTVKIGERFGMIKFGSRVDVYTPLNWKPVVHLNQIVTAGETILFELADK